MIELGCKARDRISGWEGIVVARYEYLNGCVRYEIAGSNKDGKPEGFVFDESQIEVLDEAPVKPKPPRPVKRLRGRGGPRSHEPVRRH